MANITLTPAADNDLPIFTPDGFFFATNRDDLFDGVFGTVSSIDQFLDGRFVPSFFFSGSNVDGTADVLPLGGGSTRQGGGVLLERGFISSNNISRFVGISGTLTVAPETVLGDVSLDGVVNFSDIPAFIEVLQAGLFQNEADVDQNGVVNFADIPAFIDILIRQ